MIVLGIDPGMAETGFGVVRSEGSRFRALSHGVISTPPGDPSEQRLAEIHREVTALIAAHEPDALAIEDLYVGRNPRTVLLVGQARGAVMAACGQAGVPVTAYAPAEVKTAVCGFGRAEKQQVGHMISVILGLAEPPRTSHAADALAVAVCHSQRARRNPPTELAG